jgi:hypothetical protein
MVLKDIPYPKKFENDISFDENVERSEKYSSSTNTC